MKRLRRSIIQSATITSAEGDNEFGLDDQIDELKSNFDYAVDGFDKLCREGKEGQNKANQILLQLAEAIEVANRQVADAIAGNGGQE
jgi:hypothetical protein